ncbi:MAG: hypothetical protein COB00_14815 [Alcanivorax sp.]|nr:MAG: hypothetical protein COB00_14815 [Alcanivorax sp.]
MIEIIEFFNLGEWAVVVLSVVVIWHWVVKGLVEKWFQNKLDLQKQEVGSALQIQKDIAIRKAEFEKVKLDRVLPLLEDMNSVVSQHKLMNNSYVSWIVNKAGIPEDFEKKRVALDEQLLKSIYSAEIYLPNQIRAVIRQIRKIVSCSWKDPLPIYHLLLEKGTFNSVTDVCNDANDLYGDLINCFYDMCNKYLGVSECEESYSDILNRFNFSNDVNPIDPNPAQSFLWKFILVHEYVSGGEKSEVIMGIERAYKVSENDKAV